MSLDTRPVGMGYGRMSIKNPSKFELSKLCFDLEERKALSVSTNRNGHQLFVANTTCIIGPNPDTEVS